jgi:uncharacterized RDD family membrane protein YckC
VSDEPHHHQPAGWYHAEGDRPGTQRYWNGERWEGGPQHVPGPGGASPVPAEPLNRVGARIIDIVVWALLLIPVGLVASGGSVLDPEPEVGYATQAVSSTIGVALVAAYEIYLVGATGRTIGKMVLSAITLSPIRVVRTDGTPATYGDAAVRIAPFVVLQGLAGFLGRAGQVLSIATWALAVVSVVFLFTDGRRQAVWDKLAGTMVCGQ